MAMPSSVCENKLKIKLANIGGMQDLESTSQSSTWTAAWPATNSSCGMHISIFLVEE